jgi:ATP phosphoribosyltransferase
MIASTEHTSLRIAIQKSGRLTDKTLDLLKGIGFRFDDYKRNLIVKARNFDVELLLLRDDDIPEYVQDGVCDLGFVGANERAEKEADIKVLRKLDYGICRLAVAAPVNGSIKTVKDLEGKRVATSYPVLTKNYLAEHGVQAKMVEISGAVEITPRLGVADAVADLVSTGGTLKANGLKELFTIFESETELIQTNRPLDEAKVSLIDKLLLRIDSHKTAQKSRYIMMNAPRTALSTIQGIVPAMQSPTVVNLAGDDENIAIHTVIPYDQFWVIMEKLKDAGAHDIVVLPIESMIL